MSFEPRILGKTARDSYLITRSSAYRIGGA
jgi:hypothetical protein